MKTNDVNVNVQAVDAALLPDREPTLCENCGRNPAVAEVDDSDARCGYNSTLELCAECLWIGAGRFLVVLLGVLLLSMSAPAGCLYDKVDLTWTCDWREREFTPEQRNILHCNPPTPLAVRSDIGRTYCGKASSDSCKSANSNLWRVSVVAASVGVGLDVASSLGAPRELTPLYRSADGTFGARGVTIRVGMAAGALGIQWLVMRTHPPAWVGRMFSVMNFAVGIRSSVQAAQNWRVSR